MAVPLAGEQASQSVCVTLVGGVNPSRRGTGSQQYTARNLTFNGCLTAVQMVWDWGFNWQGVSLSLLVTSHGILRADIQTDHSER